uniref:Major capsid protein N-terminal domain-containing protein n=1 Tax=viral metagenome TaxID=1070528 RepID=A0A6C0HGU6_9ZZZZ
MPGGLLNIVSYGNQNVILNGNPSKTFFKCTYAKYTNFGLQKFRLDFEGQRTLRMTEPSTFSFKVPRYADLLMDTYLVTTLPTIWSPIVPPQDCSGQWLPYEFKWIKNLGTQMINQVTFYIGGQIIQQFSGQYLTNLVERDFISTKKATYYNMTGNTAELNDPANSGTRRNVYPSAYYDASPEGPEPSIRARKIYTPLNIWFTLAAKMALPLVSLQYNELYIDIEIRPVNEMFVVRDVTSPNEMCYIQSNQNVLDFQFYRFLQPPPNVALNYADADKRTNWSADVHLISTYTFLSSDEVAVFAAQEQQFLIKQIYEYSFPNVTGTNSVYLDSLGMVADWMWYFQRSDAYLRNEWSNYTNWPYDYLPYDLVDPSGNATPLTTLTCGNVNSYTPDIDPWNTSTGLPNQPSNIFITGTYNPANQKEIMMRWGLLLDGKYRENSFDAGVYNYTEKYSKSLGSSPDGLYCYNFCLNTDPYDFQPSGAMNMSKFKNIQFEFSTFQPPLDPSASVYVICNPNGGDVIGVNKPTWRIYDYNYDLTVFEERFNVLTFTSGNAALMYAR